MSGRKAVFLDRDGTLIIDREYLGEPGGVEPLPGVFETLARLRDAGFALFIITNQSGVGRGYFSEDDVARVNARFLELASDAGIAFDGVYYCPHAPDDCCDCRKPGPKLLLDAAHDHEIDLSKSAMIGDQISDAKAGAAAGCALNVALTGPDKSAGREVVFASSLDAAVDLALERLGKEAAAGRAA